MSKRNRKATASFSNIDKAVEEKSVFGIYAGNEMLTKLKSLAVNIGKPGVNRESHKSLWDQTLQVRKVMALTATKCPMKKRKLLHTKSLPQKKRKLPQFLKDNIKGEDPLCKEQSDRKFNSGQLSQDSSTPGVFNMTDSSVYLHKRMFLKSQNSGSLLTSEDNEMLFIDDVKDLYLSNKKSSLLVGIRGSAGSNPVTPEHMDIHGTKLMDLDDSSNYSNLEELRDDRPPSLSIKLIGYVDDQFVRPPIPIGHHFQADVPEWSEVSLNGDLDSSKWLGTKVWPIERRDGRATSRAVGKGRPSSCSCASPGSTTCVRHHIREKNHLLQSDLGPLYHIWNFDEIGEEFSKSWTVKEQGRFDILAKRQSSKTNLLQNAMNCFPSKCSNDIITYYFNVFIPRFMSFQTRSLLEEVNSDVDDVKDAYNLHTRRKHKDKSNRSHQCSRKGVKAR